MMTMPFGKHKGKRLSEIPPGYLAWCLENIEDLDYWLRHEMEIIVRAATPEAPKQLDVTQSVRSQMRETVKRWYRHASMRHHPDHGGTDERQRVVNECYEDLLSGVERLEVLA